MNLRHPVQSIAFGGHFIVQCGGQISATSYMHNAGNISRFYMCFVMCGTNIEIVDLNMEM